MSAQSLTKSCCGTGGKGITTLLSDWRVLLAGAVGIGGALWFGWPWLVVAGLAPLIIALAPCLLMCGAMCAMKACSKPATTTDNLAEVSPKLLTHETMKPLASVVSPEFSGGLLQTASPPAETRVVA